MTDEQQLTAAGNEMSASFLAAKKRSDETLAKLEAKPSSFTMLTGDRPTGRLVEVLVDMFFIRGAKV